MKIIAVALSALLLTSSASFAKDPQVDMWKTHLTEQTTIILGAYACEVYYPGRYDSEITVEIADEYLEHQITAAAEDTGVSKNSWATWANDMIRIVGEQYSAFFLDSTMISEQIELCEGLVSGEPELLKRAQFI